MSSHSNTMSMNNTMNETDHTEVSDKRRNSQDAVQMAGSLFSHILAHLKSKDGTSGSSEMGMPYSNYLLTPQKSGAFTRLTPSKRDNDCTSTTSTTTTPVRKGVQLIRPIPVYPSNFNVDSMSCKS